MNTLIKQWIAVSTIDDLKALAHHAGTSTAYLYQLSGGFRQASPELAIAIERETERMHRETKGRLPRIYRTDLARACANCAFAHKCLGAAAVRSEFDVVPDEDGGEETRG